MSSIDKKTKYKKAPSLKKFLIIVHTGDGKGKTTAAMGMIIRTITHGWNAAVVQFLKKETAYKYAEQKLAKKFENLDVYTIGAGFTWDIKNKETQIKKTLEAWEKSKKLIFSKKYRMILLDEINYALDFGFLDEKEVLEVLEKKPEKLHLILTGRNAKKSIIKKADLVTEMKNIKHPFEKGILAQKGVDW
ncbi:MAG: cob(I)yrinic acid a,c-diamide adenosyltransferase [Spirochaetia bacterium]|nr:cob(I)yrinic acid a,c-diamide adenosyltransferase [Spirochaetia bacterium]